MVTKWNDLFKIKIDNSDESFQHHEVVKTLLVMKLINKNSSNKNWIRIYTEFELENGLRTDVYFENLKTKSVICYEIQKKFNKGWLKEKQGKYGELNIPFMKTIDFIPISLNDLSKDIEELNKQLEEYVF